MYTAEVSKAARATSGEKFYLPDDPLIADFVADLLRKNRSPRTMEAYTPVSYTHLDVYKRQVLVWIAY